MKVFFFSVFIRKAYYRIVREAVSLLKLFLTMFPFGPLDSMRDFCDARSRSFLKNREEGSDDAKTKPFEEPLFLIVERGA